jgi:hypothetical protein
MQPPPAARAQSGYGLLGVLDPHFDNMVAFALKVPNGWHAKQSFTRRWKGALPQNQIYLSLRSPDGRTQIEYLPSVEYAYSSGPMTDNLRAQARAFGMPAQRTDDELAPMAPVAYIQQVLLSRLSRDGLVLRDAHNPREAPERRVDGQTIETRGSLDGVLPNGNRARVECRINVQTQQLNGETYYGWSVIPSITQTAGDLAAAHAHTLVAQQSIVRNPAWWERMRAAQNQGQQQNSALSRAQHEQTMGQIQANTAAMQQAHAQRMRDIQSAGEANTARFNERMAAMDDNHAAFRGRMASQDRQHEAFVDTVRGQQKFEDPGTGQRVKLEDGYRHVYTDRQGNYYGSDTRIEASAVDWQELRRVSLSEY